MKAEAVCRRAGVRKGEKRNDAIREGKKALQNLSGDVEFVTRVAFSLIESDVSNWSEAQGLLEKASEPGPRSSELHAALGICYVMHGGKDREAYDELKKAIQLNPHDDKLYSILARVISTGRQVTAYEGEALQLLRKAITLNPEYWVYYKSLGLEYWKAGRSIDAKFSFEMAQEKMRSGGIGIDGNIIKQEQKRLEEWIKAVKQNQAYWEGWTSQAI
jgi:tetratricopeptide (TPR) repeat protein